MTNYGSSYGAYKIPFCFRSHWAFNCSAKGIIFMSQEPLLTEHPSHVGLMQHSPAAGKFVFKVTVSVLSEGVGMGGGSPWGGAVGFGDCDSGSGVE
jgi:hypothetical protein